MNSTIDVRKELSAHSLRFISFPATAGNVTPSYLLYDESSVESLRSALPLQPGSAVQLPFLVYASDSLWAWRGGLTAARCDWTSCTRAPPTAATRARPPTSTPSSSTSRCCDCRRRSSTSRSRRPRRRSRVPVCSKVLFLPLSPAVREYRQQTLGKTLLVSAGLRAAWPVSLCVFAPLGLLPPATRLSRLAVKRAREAETAVEVLLARNPLSDLGQTSIDPAMLTSLLPVWDTLVRRSGWAAQRKEEERKLVLLQAGAVRARGVLQLACEMSRFVAARETSLHELLQNVFVFWNSEKEKKFGYLSLTQLCLECSPQLMRGVTLLPEAQRVRYCDFSIRDKEGAAVKFAMQGALRMYKAAPGSTLSVIYVVSDEVKKPGTVHQMCGWMGESDA